MALSTKQKQKLMDLIAAEGRERGVQLDQPAELANHCLWVIEQMLDKIDPAEVTKITDFAKARSKTLKLAELEKVKENAIEMGVQADTEIEELNAES